VAVVVARVVQSHAGSCTLPPFVTSERALTPSGR
jgi:hypothetical protein